MKISGQSVPPSLLAAYRLLVSTDLAGKWANTRARTRRGVRTKPRRPSQYFNISVNKLIASFIVTRRIATGEMLSRSGEIRAMMRELNQNIVNPMYWRSLYAAAPSTRLSVPVSEPRDFSTTYLYPDLTNKPTRPTYPIGSISSGNAEYAGHTEGDRFYDLSLKWHRYRFNLISDLSLLPWEPVMIHASGTITITASARNCKPMRSVALKWWLGNGDHDELSISNPPVTKRKTIYPKVKAAPTAPPYFAATQQFERAFCTNYSNKMVLPGQRNRLQVDICPLALMGKWYNNNTAVSTILDESVLAYRVFIKYWNEQVIFPAQAPGKFICATLGIVAVFTESSFWYWSRDGKNWTLDFDPLVPFDIFRAVALPTCILVWSRSQGLFCIENAKKKPVSVGNQEMYFLATAGELAVALSQWTQKAWSSVDGKTWNYLGIHDGATVTNIVGCRGGFLLISNDQKLRHSYNGIDWLNMWLVNGWNIYACAYYEGMWAISVLVAGYMDVWYGTDLGAPMTRLVHVMTAIPFLVWETIDGIEAAGVGSATHSWSPSTGWVTETRVNSNFIIGAAKLDARTIALNWDGIIEYHHRHDSMPAP